MVRQSIEHAVREALGSMGAGEVLFVVERPATMEHGDYATNAALAAAKVLKKSPREVAELLTKNLLSQKSSDIEKIEVAGAGFINFFLTREAIVKTIATAATDQSFGKNTLYKDKKVLVEYTDPNPFKEFHIGHLVPNTMGESLAHLFEWAGAEVKRVNYQGDVGRHVARAIWGLLQSGDSPDDVQALGRAYAAGAAADVEGMPARDEITELNKKIYSRSDDTVNDLYDRGRAASLAKFEDIYAILGTKFAHYFFESEAGPLGATLVKEHIADGIFEVSDGATIYRGEKHGLHTRVLLNKEGLPTYEAKELALAKLKNDWYPYDRSVVVTANEIKEYFKVLLAAMGEIYPELASKTTHITHGVMKLTEGKMSSRTGNIIAGEALIRDLAQVALEKMADRVVTDKETIAKQIAVGAIKYTILKQGSGRDIIFDPEKSLSLEGDSGPYLQYAHTRAMSLVAAAKEQGIMPGTGESVSEASPLRPAAGEADSPVLATRSTLERLLVHFPDAVSRAGMELEPHYVTTYLTELASAFNSWYASERIIGGDNEEYGVLLASAVEKTLAKGLEILAIPAPQEM